MQKKNTVVPDSPQMTIWRMRIACWITKVTSTHSEYVIIFAFATATVVARTRLNVPLYVHCLSCESFAVVNLRSPFFWDVAQRHWGDWATAHWRDATPYTPLYALLFVNIYRPPLQHDCSWNAVRGVQTSVAVQLRPSFFWDVTPCRLVVGYRCFGTTYRSHLQG